jgi:5-methylcytosine-specific restriction endonuclease McrA
MEARMVRNNQEKPYRARALKLFPWICAHCGREFDGKKLSQLTVHHKDHNHDNNPPDGSNWELLCLYCHDNEHQRYQVDGGSDESPSTHEPDRPFTPFAHLTNLLKRNTVA